MHRPWGRIHPVCGQRNTRPGDLERLLAEFVRQSDDNLRATDPYPESVTERARNGRV
ncbi:MAG TPA: hypothetical protein VG122_20520 [Gemmata sp.]|nr:hypothetical protein [Gemmata sp.]